MSSYAAATRGIGVPSMARGRASFLGRGRGAVVRGRGQSGPLAGAPSPNPSQFNSAFPNSESPAALDSSQDQQQKNCGVRVERSDAMSAAGVTATAPPDTVEQSMPQQLAPDSMQSEEPASPRTLQDLMRAAAHPTTKTAKIVSLNGRRTHPPGQQMAPQQRSNDEQQMTLQRADGASQQMPEPPDASDSEWGTPVDAWGQTTTSEGQQAPSECTMLSPGTIDEVREATLRAEAKGQVHASAGTTSTEAAPLAEPPADVVFSTPSLSGGGEFRRPTGFFGSTGLNNNGSESAASLAQDPSQSNENVKLLVESSHRKSSRGGGADAPARGGGRGFSKWRGGGFGGTTARQQQQVDADRDDNWRAHRRNSGAENADYEGSGFGDARPPRDTTAAAGGYGLTGQTWGGQSFGNTTQELAQQEQFSTRPSLVYGFDNNVSGSDVFDNSGFANAKAIGSGEKRVAVVAQAPPSSASIGGSPSVTIAAAADHTLMAPPMPVPTAEPAGQSVHNLSRSSVQLKNARLNQLSTLVSADRPDSQPQSGQAASVAPPEVIRPPNKSEEPRPSDHSVDRQAPERAETAPYVEVPAPREAPRPPVAVQAPVGFCELIQILTHQHRMLTDGVMVAICLYDQTNPGHFEMLPQFIELLHAAGLNTPDGLGPIFDDFGNIRAPTQPAAAQRQDNAHRLAAPRQPTAHQPSMPPARPVLDQRQETAPPVLQPAGLNAPQGRMRVTDDNRALRGAPPLRQMAPTFRPPAPLRPVSAARLAPAQLQEPAQMVLQPAGLNAPQGPTPIGDLDRAPREAPPLRQMAPSFRAPSPLRPVSAARLAPAQLQDPGQRQAASNSSATDVDSLGNELW